MMIVALSGVLIHDHLNIVILQILSLSLSFTLALSLSLICGGSTYLVLKVLFLMKQNYRRANLSVTESYKQVSFLYHLMFEEIQVSCNRKSSVSILVVYCLDLQTYLNI